MDIYVGEDSPTPNTNGMRNDVVQALRQIRVPLLRWPGACFADRYHGKDGVGEKATRKKIVNTQWGGVVEDNSFGTAIASSWQISRKSQMYCRPFF